MTKRGNQLLWNRMRLTLPHTTIGDGGNIPHPVDVDTGLCQPTLAFEHGEPILDGEDPSLPFVGVPSRVQVLPMLPWSAFDDVTHAEPYFDDATGTVHVVMLNSNLFADVEVNVLFWDPHLYISPGDADCYSMYGGRPFPPFPP
jgi:hypothetical protein